MGDRQSEKPERTFWGELCSGRLRQSNDPHASALLWSENSPRLQSDFVYRSRFSGDPDLWNDFQSYPSGLNMPDNDGNQIQAVSLKLPTFWTEQPQVWFVQAEAQFVLRNITADDTKYHYVVAALDQDTAKRVIDLLSVPPGVGKYNALKARLKDTYGLSEFDRGTRLLHVPVLGDDKPSALMDNMLALLGSHQPCFLFRALFLERLPEEIRGVLVYSQEQDSRRLAKAADTLWEARSTATNAIRLSRQSATTSVPVKKNSDFCYYHARFGDQAQKCQKPC